MLNKDNVLSNTFIKYYACDLENCSIERVIAGEIYDLAFKEGVEAGRAHPGATPSEVINNCDYLRSLFGQQ